MVGLRCARSKDQVATGAAEIGQNLLTGFIKELASSAADGMGTRRVAKEVSLDPCHPVGHLGIERRSGGMVEIELTERHD